jgi:hypothetical protein
VIKGIDDDDIHTVKGDDKMYNMKEGRRFRNRPGEKEKKEEVTTTEQNKTRSRVSKKTEE